MQSTLIFQGGLGNQMFQYAFLTYLKSIGRTDIKIFTNARSLKKHHGFELEKIFSKLFFDKYEYNDSFILSVFFNVLMELRSRVKFSYPNLLYEDMNNANSLNNIETKKIFIGFFQNYIYPNANRESLLEKFSFRDLEESEDDCKIILEEIKNTPNSVSIHIRRGDYLQSNLASYYGNICTLDYYKSAIEYMKSKLPEIKFFVFSDDLSWVKQHIKLDHATYVGCNTREYSFRDMQLMSNCKHQIIANSSFSWWGAWLNNFGDKIVVAPSTWYNLPNNQFAENLILPTWLRMDSRGELIHCGNS